jgi:hypothetical protein
MIDIDKDELYLSSGNERLLVSGFGFCVVIGYATFAVLYVVARFHEKHNLFWKDT